MQVKIFIQYQGWNNTGISFVNHHKPWFCHFVWFHSPHETTLWYNTNIIIVSHVQVMVGDCPRLMIMIKWFLTALIWIDVCLKQHCVTFLVQCLKSACTKAEMSHESYKYVPNKNVIDEFEYFHSWVSGLTQPAAEFSLYL